MFNFTKVTTLSSQNLNLSVEENEMIRFIEQTAKSVPVFDFYVSGETAIALTVENNTVTLVWGKEFTLELLEDFVRHTYPSMKNFLVYLKQEIPCPAGWKQTSVCYSLVNTECHVGDYTATDLGNGLMNIQTRYGAAVIAVAGVAGTLILTDEPCSAQTWGLVYDIAGNFAKEGRPFTVQTTTPKWNEFLYQNSDFEFRSQSISKTYA